MNELFAAFGIDWRLLLVNMINFGLLLAALWYFLYEPLTKTLDARRQRLAEGVAAAQEADDRLRRIEASRAELLAKAGKEADDVIAQAREAGTSKQHEIVSAAEASANAILSDAQAQAVELKREAIAQSKQEVAKLIVLGMERTMKETKV
jgi:F-type H+-transporting ATPase subunit b